MERNIRNRLQTRWIILLAVALTLLVGLSVLKSDTKSGSISKNDAIIKVKALPEVKDYLKIVPNGLVAVNGEENKIYEVQVYELKNGHSATFNWYAVDKNTGKVKKEF